MQRHPRDGDAVRAPARGRRGLPRLGARPDRRGVVIARVEYDYPYRLKVLHPEMAELRLHRKGRTIVFDPATPPREELAILTGPSPARSRGILEAVRAGARPTVWAPEPLLEWLATEGGVERAGAEVDGVRISGMAYTAPPGARPLGHFIQASLHAARPRATFRRIAQAARMPACDPQIVELAFPDGTRLLHLDLSLNRNTEEAWVTRAAAQFGNPDWIVVGADWGESEAVARWLPRFGPNRVLVVELVNGERREQGLPTELVTPLRDRLVAQGIEAHVFATQASYRFE